MSRSQPRIVLLRENQARGDRSVTIETKEIAEALKARGFKSRAINAEMPPTRLAKKIADQTADAVLILPMPSAFHYDLASNVAAWVEGLGYPLIGPSARCRTLCSQPETARALLRGFGLPVAEETSSTTLRNAAILASPETIVIGGVDDFDAETKTTIVRLAKSAFDALSCRDYANISFLVDSSEIRVVAVDPTPRFGPGCSWREAIERSGRDFGEVFASLARRAMDRGEGD